METNKTTAPSKNETLKKAMEKTPKKTVPQGKTIKELKEIAQHLQTQMEQHQTATVEFRGALKAVLQMIPQETK
jgi:hypothetical protein|tara:strand:- start:448 stop:669 length:222 start_codon:yes stop_codon:yes gene_type:complete